jgi:hypothetical protein
MTEFDRHEGHLFAQHPLLESLFRCGKGHLISNRERLLRFDGDAGLEVGEGLLEAFSEGDLWFPAEQGAGLGDVGAAARGVVLGQRLVDYFGF